jgi:adenylate cyclase
MAPYPRWTQATAARQVLTDEARWLGTIVSTLTGSAATFVFADIAGFTALTEAHGDEQAAALVTDFREAVNAELPASAAHVKTIGDALMLRIPDPSQAILLGLEITHGLMPRHGSPAVRVGLHHGPAVERNGDYFGATVNLAARVSGLASGGEVLLTGHTAALAPDLGGVLYEARGREVLRNVREPVEIFAAVRRSESTVGRLPVDPVCRMAVDPDRAAGRLLHRLLLLHAGVRGRVRSRPRPLPHLSRLPGTRFALTEEEPQRSNRAK